MTQPPDETFAEPGTVRTPASEDDGREGGKTAPGSTTAPTGQLDSASGGYGTQSGRGTSGGSGEGEPQDGDADGAGAPTATGASGETPTDWLRGGGTPDARTQEDVQ